MIFFLAEMQQWLLPRISRAGSPDHKAFASRHMKWTEKAVLGIVLFFRPSVFCISVFGSSHCHSDHS